MFYHGQQNPAHSDKWQTIKGSERTNYAKRHQCWRSAWYQRYGKSMQADLPRGSEGGSMAGGGSTSDNSN